MSQLSTQQECPGQLFSLIKDNKDAVKISPRKFKYIHSALSHFIRALPLSNSIQVQGSHHYLCAASLRLGLSSEKLSHPNCWDTATWILQDLKLKIVQNLPKFMLIESGRLFQVSMTPKNIHNLFPC